LQKILFFFAVFGISPDFMNDFTKVGGQPKASPTVVEVVTGPRGNSSRRHQSHPTPIKRNKKVALPRNLALQDLLPVQHGFVSSRRRKLLSRTGKSLSSTWDLILS
jgi:hypothetical protein